MANTYIHTLPDSSETLDAAAYTILDSKNIFNEYITSKLSLSALSDFVNGEYILTEEHLATKRATSWVNSNSSNLKIESLNLFVTGTDIDFNTISVLDDRNATSYILIKNANTNNLVKTEIVFQNSLTSSNFKFGTLGQNYNSNNWTIGESKNDAYIYGEEKTLIIGTQGSDKDLILFTGGPFIGNERIVAKGDGSGRVGINITNPNATLTVNGNISSNGSIFSQHGNSTQWNNAYSYSFLNSSKNEQSTNLIQSISSNLVFRTGSLITGTLNTTQTLTGAFQIDDFITRRYVDAVVLQSNISGNFIPALYYTKAETDDILIQPYSVYSHVNLNSAIDLESRTFINTNSSIFLNLNTNINQTSGRWESVYSYVNQASAQEEDQTEVTNFIISNSSNLLQVNSFVNNNSSSLNDLYTFTSNNSSLELEVRTYVNSNSSQINQNNNLVSNNSPLWSESYTVNQTYSTANINTTTIVNTNSANWTNSYTTYAGNSGTYTTYQYVNNGFLPLSGGKVTGNLFAGSLGIGNSVSIGGTLGTLSRRIEIFDINGSSIGFIPVYGSIT